MDEEESTINNSNNIIPSTLNSHRLHVRRNILRQTTSLRSSPYNATSSNLRRRQQQQRQNSFISSQTINNLITNIETNHRNSISNDLSTSLNEQNENEIIEEISLDTSEDEDNQENFEVLVDFANASPIDLTIENENNQISDSYHSVSALDFHPDDDDDDHYYYMSTSRPVFDYSSSSSEPLNIQNHSIDPIEYNQANEYSSSINNNLNNINNDDEDEDLSIEIILESSQNNSLSPISRRRRSVISSNHRGLRLSEILNIPQKIYSSLKQQFNTQCYICLEDFQLIDLIKILHCQHIFHTACINEWLRMHSNCAYCRTSAVSEMSRTNMATPGTTTGRRQRTRARRNLIRSTTNQTIESSTFEPQP